MMTVVPKSSQAPVAMLAGMSVVGFGGFLFNGDGWMALACLVVAGTCLVALAIMATREA
jgi:hypothetical protein